MCVINPHIDRKSVRVCVCVCYIQCWRKQFFKVMHYNIALLPKKVTNFISYYFWKIMRYITIEILFKSGQGLLVFNIKSYFFYKCKSLSQQK